MSSGKVPAPYALAMVVADAIWRDPSTGKRTILGCFGSIMAHEFPAMHPQLAVYVALTEGRGIVPVKLQMVDAEEEGEPVVEATGEVEFKDRRTILELDFHFRGVTFPHTGEFRIQLFASGEFLLEAIRKVFSENSRLCSCGLAVVEWHRPRGRREPAEHAGESN